VSLPEKSSLQLPCSSSACVLQFNDCMHEVSLTLRILIGYSQKQQLSLAGNLSHLELLWSCCST
jgi:hypothetical protein